MPARYQPGGCPTIAAARDALSAASRHSLPEPSNGWMQTTEPEMDCTRPVVVDDPQEAMTEPNAVTTINRTLPRTRRVSHINVDSSTQPVTDRRLGSVRADVASKSPLRR